MKKLALTFFVLTFLSFSFSFASCKETHFDIIQGKSFKENTLIVEIDGNKYTFNIKDDISKKETQDQIQKWFDGLVKELCE